MFNKQHKSIFTISQATQQRLNSVMASYQKITMGDPSKFRLAIPSNEVWRLFVDVVKYNDYVPWFEFEMKEPGYMHAMYTAFQKIHGQSKVDADFIMQLHLAATTNVTGSINYVSQKDTIEKPGKFRTKPQGGYFISIHRGNPNCTLSGLNALLARNKSYIEIIVGISRLRPFHGVTINQAFMEELRKFKAEPSFDFFKYLDTFSPYIHKEALQSFHPNSDNAKALRKFMIALSQTKNEKELADCIYKYEKINSLSSSLVFSQVSHQKNDTYQTLCQEVNRIIAKYEQEIAMAKNDVEKILAIISCIQKIEQLHPFLDGNCRVLCMLLLNHLLLRNHLPFVILNDPNRFDLWSREELFEEMLKGMENIMELIHTKKLGEHITSEGLAEVPSHALKIFNDAVKIEEEARKSVPLIFLGLKAN